MANGTQMTLDEFMPGIFHEPTSGALDSPAKTSPLQENKQGFRETVQACFSELCTFADNSKKKVNPLTYSLRTLKISLALMEDGTLPDFSLKWTGGGYDAEWQTLNSKNFGVPQNRERAFIIGHLRGRSTAEVFPVEGTDGENHIHGIGHRDGYRRNMQIFAPDGITETLDTGEGGGRGHHTIQVVGHTRESKFGDRTRILSGGGISQSMTATDYKNPAKVAIPVLTPDRANKRQNGRRFKDDGEPAFTLTGKDVHGVVVDVRSSERGN